ncbi:sigma-70 family RNA polymerase sigma factor [Bradyrhizobium guangzhouense]|nr:sigma-70 family RNA polymerase sigma factor [Bradyrhizobium guangzhouense]
MTRWPMPFACRRSQGRFPHAPHAIGKWTVAWCRKMSATRCCSRMLPRATRPPCTLYSSVTRERVLRFIKRLARDPAVVDDLVNQVFLDVWRSANRFENRARVATWLFSIARFKAISSWRERTHEDIDQDDAPGIVYAPDTPDAALDHKETNGILRACIDKLSPAHREIIDMYYYREKPVAEVSGLIGIPEATVKSRLFYARKRLARILMDAGFDAAAARTSLGISLFRATDELPAAK